MIGKKGILRFFYKVTMVCYKKLHLWRIPIPGRDKVQADLNRMHPGENPQECVTDYYVTKLTLSAVILIAGIVLAITMHYSSRESHVLQNQWVYRGSGEEGSREYSITGQVEDGERYSFQMEVMPRKYSQSELENLYEQFGRELPQLILEKNDSPDEIRENLDLSETYEGYPFLVNWKSNSTEAVEENGQIHPGQEDVPVLLRAEIQYGEFVRETTVKVTVVKRNETPQEREKSKLSELLQRAQEEDPESEKIQLPTEIEGRKISWEEDIPETGWKILAGALLLAAAVFFFQDKDLHDLVEKKKREERRSYPEILQKLTLYLEAGLTVRSAFCRVAEDYEKERKRGGRCREAYEEMLIATREIHMGVPEGAAYENFGKRTGVREYVRLSTFLTQNLKKGSSTLLQQLKEESVQAEELLKDPLQLFLRNCLSMILTDAYDVVAVFLYTQEYLCIGKTVIYRVSEQIVEYSLDFFTVTAYHEIRTGVDNACQFLFTHHRVEFKHDLFQQPLNVYSRHLQRDMCEIESRDFKKFVNQVFEAFRAVQRDRQILLPQLF